MRPDEKTLEKITIKVWEVRGSLRGLGSLLENQQLDPFYKADDLYGLGQLLKGLSKELVKVEDGLNGAEDWQRDIDEDGEQEDDDEEDEGEETEEESK